MRSIKKSSRMRKGARRGFNACKAAEETGAGFTLVELVMTVSLVGLLCVAIYGTLSNGLRIFKQASQELVMADTNIFLDRFCADIKNTFLFNEVDFVGQPERLEVAALVASPAVEGKSVGKVVYSYDAQARVFSRKLLDYSAWYNKDEGRSTDTIANIKSLSLRYFHFNKEKNAYEWIQEWPDTSLPLAVEMAAEFSQGAKTSVVTRMASIACAK